MTADTSELPDLVTCEACEQSYSILIEDCPNCGQKNPRWSAAASTGEAKKFDQHPRAADTPEAARAEERSPQVMPPLEKQLEDLQAQDRNRATIILFGSAGAGKTFLIDRLKDQFPDGTLLTKPTQNRPATRTNEFSAISLHPKDFGRRITLIDIPGEEFHQATAKSGGQSFRQIVVTMNRLNGLILYISARDLLRRGFGGQYARGSGTTRGPTQFSYIDLLKVVHLVALRPGTAEAALTAVRLSQDDPLVERVDLPVFVAISQCDIFPGWESGSLPSGEELLRKHCPGIVVALERRFRYVACGLVASHVNAQAFTGLTFTRMDHETGTPRAVPYGECEGLLPESHPFQDFLKEHWMNAARAENDPELSGLPSDWLPGRTESDHDADAEAFFADKRCFDDVGNYLKEKHGVDVGKSPFVHAACPSYGVRAMIHQLAALFEAREKGADPDAISAYLLQAGANGPEHSFWRGLPARLCRPLIWPIYAAWPEMFVLTRKPRRIAIVALLASLLTVLLLLGQRYAESVANEHNNGLKTKLASLDYPPRFAVKPADAWALEPSEVEELLHSVAASPHTFGIHDDFLVRVPDLTVDAHVDEKTIPIQALRTPGASGSRAEWMYALLQCPPTSRKCKVDLNALKRPPIASNPRDARVESYAQALATYYGLTTYHQNNEASVGPLKEIERLLREFEERRSKSFGPLDLSNKNKSLPQLATELIRAHASFVASTRKDALAGYGAALNQALSAKGKVTREELRLIGVSQAQLAMHLLATSLSDDIAPGDQLAQMQRRLALVGIDGPATIFRDSLMRQATSEYSDLLCIMGQLLPAGSDKDAAVTDIRRACSDAGPSAGSTAFWQRARLADEAFWASRDTSQKMSVSLDQFLPVIKKAAQYPEFAKPVRDGTKNDLGVIRSLERESWHSVMRRPSWLLAFAGLLAGTVFLGWLLDTAGKWALGRSLFTARSRPD